MAKRIADIRSLARDQTELCIKVLKSIAAQTSAPAAARVAAVTVLLDRGWGKAIQPIAELPAAPEELFIDEKTMLGAVQRYLYIAHKAQKLSNDDDEIIDVVEQELKTVN